MADIVKDEYFEKVQSFLEANEYRHEPKCAKVTESEGNYHIYDLPKMIVFGSEKKLKEFIGFLQSEGIVASAFKCRVGASFESNPQ